MKETKFYEIKEKCKKSEENLKTLQESCVLLTSELKETQKSLHKVSESLTSSEQAVEAKQLNIKEEIFVQNSIKQYAEDFNEFVVTSESLEFNKIELLIGSIQEDF